MSNKRQIIPIAGLLATIAIAIYFVVQLNAQGTGPSGNLTNAAVAEVKNAQGQVVLQGQFAQADEDDDDVERKAVLKPTGIDADAAGEAEVEFARTSPAVQEVEFSISGVEIGSTFDVRHRRAGDRHRHGRSPGSGGVGSGRQDAARAAAVAVMTGTSIG